MTIPIEYQIAIEALQSRVSELEDAFNKAFGPKYLSNMAAFEHIVETAARTSGVDVRSIMSSRRNATVVLVRFACIMIIRQKTDASDIIIGKFFGNRDRTTITHAFARAKHEYELGLEFTEIVNDILAAL